MGLKCGIVGLPNIGKSTLFNALSKNNALAANYPFCTIEPNIGIVKVPDTRLKVLADLVGSKKIIPAIIEFVDIAGLVKGASKGEGLGNRFLAHIREVDVIIHVVRFFEDKNISHVEKNINPIMDKEIIDTELQIKDAEFIQKKIPKMHKLAQTGNKDEKKALSTLEKCLAYLEQGKNIRMLDMQKEEIEIIKEMNLLTQKPLIYVANIGETTNISKNPYVKLLKEHIQNEKAKMIVMNASLEAQIASLENEEEKEFFLKEYDIEESGLDQLIKTAYRFLSLVTFFTAGKEEVRAWTIPQSTKAPQAAGSIHSDMEKGFIKAEVIKLNDYIRLHGSENDCREAGKLRIEGKDYIIQDGDIIHFRFNI